MVSDRSKLKGWELSLDSRLDGWKEIASYLKRDVRTAQRWESEENLPVHRHIHKSTASVFAFRSELDAWWKNHADRFDQMDRVTKPYTKASLSKIVSVSVAFILVVAIGWWATRQTNWRDSETVATHWVLLADFENLTGGEIPKGTLSNALENELVNLPTVNVMTRPRIDEALGLMKKLPDTPLTRFIGREVCLRDGNVAVFLTGRIEKTDAGFRLSVQLVNAYDSLGIAAHSVHVDNASEVLAAAEEFSDWLDQVLRELDSQISRPNQQLRKVTTSSLRALELFTQADILLREATQRLNNSEEYAKIAEILRASIDEDPEFAAAHTWLAWTLHNQGRPAEEYLVMADKAVEISTDVSERERCIINGSYHALAGDLEAAIPYWEALLELYPNDYWGISNLQAFYIETGNRDEGYLLRIEMADLRPDDFSANQAAAYFSVYVAGDRVRAKKYYLRARELMSPEIIEETPRQAVWINNYPAFESWLDGDIDSTLEIAEARIAELQSLRGEWQSIFARELGRICFALGQIQRAREFYEESNLNKHQWMLAAFEMKAAVEPSRTLGEELKLRKDPYAPFVLARTSQLEKAEEIISRYEKAEPNWLREFFQIWRGELARVRGEYVRAITLLEAGLARPNSGIPGFFYLAAESLACVLEEQGELRSAARVLEVASQRKPRLVNMAQAAFWLKNEMLLADLYWKMGREKEAQSIELELRRLLKYADPDHPILLWLKQHDNPMPQQVSSAK